MQKFTSRVQSHNEDLQSLIHIIQQTELDIANEEEELALRERDRKMLKGVEVVSLPSGKM